MELLNLEQGSQKWLDKRLECFTASEAPAMMNESKHMSRNELLDLKNGYKAAEFNKFTLSIFEKGHQAEEDQRKILCIETLEEWKPVVGVVNIDGIERELLASLDGLPQEIESVSFLSRTPWEHKLWNKTLAANVRNKVLEPHYIWQLEHQALVADCDEVIFTCSDGGVINRESFIYKSDPILRRKLIEGWARFEKDLASHTIEAKKEAVTAVKAESFPSVKCEIVGNKVVTNFSEIIPAIKQMSEYQLSIILDTDQDFANKEQFNKDVKKARAMLKEKMSTVEAEFESLSFAKKDAALIDSILQKMQSHGEKQVKTAKEDKKLSIIAKAKSDLTEHVMTLNESLNGFIITMDMLTFDFEVAMKGKRNFESIKNAVDNVLSEAEHEACLIAELVIKNQETYSNLACDHQFLFADINDLLTKKNDDLKNLINARISEHEDFEAKRIAKIKEDARIEAEQKAEREAKEKEAALISEQREKRCADEKEFDLLKVGESKKQEDEIMVAVNEIREFPALKEINTAHLNNDDLDISRFINVHANDGEFHEVIKSLIFSGGQCEVQRNVQRLVDLFNYYRSKS